MVRAQSSRNINKKLMFIDCIWQTNEENMLMEIFLQIKID